MQRFEDRVALVTGAASGIGRATAFRLAEEGARLMCVDVQGEALEDTAKLVRERGAEVLTRLCDVAEPEQVEATVAGHPWTAAYSASKGGVLAFTYTLAIEYGKQGLRANAVCPGSVSTPIQDAFKLPEGADRKLLFRIMPLDEFRGPETAASVIAFLASDDAAHINGERVRVDGATLS